MNEAEDDRREGDAKEGVRSREGVTPPTPWREFIEAFRSSVGVEDRASPPRLIELGLRWRGIRGTFPFGDADELLHCR